MKGLQSRGETGPEPSCLGGPGVWMCGRGGHGCCCLAGIGHPKDAGWGDEVSGYYCMVYMSCYESIQFLNS